MTISKKLTNIFKEIDRIISETKQTEPNKTGTDYADGWSGACYILGNNIKEFLKSRL
jgi:hypothetical protein